MQAIDSLLQLARRLDAAQHQHREQRQLGVVETERLAQQVPVLARATAGAAGEPRPSPQARWRSASITVASS